MFRGGLWRVDPGLGNKRKGAWLLPVLFVLILWVILQLSKHRGLLWDSLIFFLFFIFPRHKFIYCSRSCLSERVWLTCENPEPSHGKWGKKAPNFKYPAPLFPAQQWVRNACFPLLPACVLLYLIFSFFGMMFMETCCKLFLISLQAWKSSLEGCV